LNHIFFLKPSLSEALRPGDSVEVLRFNFFAILKTLLIAKFSLKAEAFTNLMGRHRVPIEFTINELINFVFPQLVLLEQKIFFIQDIFIEKALKGIKDIIKIITNSYFDSVIRGITELKQGFFLQASDIYYNFFLKLDDEIFSYSGLSLISSLPNKNFTSYSHEQLSSIFSDILKLLLFKELGFNVKEQEFKRLVEPHLVAFSYELVQLFDDRKRDIEEKIFYKQWILIEKPLRAKIAFIKQSIILYCNTVMRNIKEKKGLPPSFDLYYEVFKLFKSRSYFELLLSGVLLYIEHLIIRGYSHEVLSGFLHNILKILLFKELGFEKFEGGLKERAPAIQFAIKGLVGLLEEKEMEIKKGITSKQHIIIENCLRPIRDNIKTLTAGYVNAVRHDIKEKKGLFLPSFDFYYELFK
jgi:hypothetical protein